MISLNIIVLLFTLFRAGYTPTASTTIITRHDIDDDQYVLLAKKYPVTESLFFFNKTDMAGTLVGDNWVLSAAHVATYLKIGDSISSRARKYPITQIIFHPEWLDDQAYDLALIRIDMGDDRLTPVPLYQARDELQQVVIVAGIGDKGTGLTGPDGNDGRMRAATNCIAEVSDFWLKWDFNSPDDETVFTTEYEGVYGVREYYVRLSSHLDWIYAILSNN